MTVILVNLLQSRETISLDKIEFATFNLLYTIPAPALILLLSIKSLWITPVAEYYNTWFAFVKSVVNYDNVNVLSIIFDPFNEIISLDWIELFKLIYEYAIFAFVFIYALFIEFIKLSFVCGIFAFATISLFVIYPVKFNKL